MRRRNVSPRPRSPPSGGELSSLILAIIIEYIAKSIIHRLLKPHKEQQPVKTAQVYPHGDVRNGTPPKARRNGNSALLTVVIIIALLLELFLGALFLIELFNSSSLNVNLLTHLIELPMIVAALLMATSAWNRPTEARQTSITGLLHALETELDRRGSRYPLNQTESEALDAFALDTLGLTQADYDRARQLAATQTLEPVKLPQEN